MLKSTVVFLFIVLIALVSCDKLLMKEKRQEIDKINLWGLLDTLHTQVYRANPLLIKKGLLDGQSDSASLHLDSIHWQKEFENFSDLKLRPGRLLSQYDETKVDLDSGTQYFYSSKNFEKEALDSFLIELGPGENVQNLKAFINSDNYFSSSAQVLTLHFIQNNAQKSFPERYSIKGWQKIRSKDTVHFQVDALIKY